MFGMTSPTSTVTPQQTAGSTFGNPLIVLGIVMGIMMPIVSAAIYPTYTHMMTAPGAEWTRLIEAPFVLAEICFISWAIHRGMAPSQMFATAPRDVKIALTLLIVGVFMSSVLFSKRPADSITISFITMIHLLFVMDVADLQRSAGIFSQHRFAYLLGGGLAALALLTAWRFLLPPDPAEVMGGVIIWSASLPGFINVRHFGSWTGAVSAAFLVILLNDKDHRAPGWPHLFYFLAIAMTIWSGTRAAILALVIASTVIVAMNRRLPTLRTFGIIAILTGAGATAAWLLIPYDDPTFHLFAGRAAETSDDVASGRLAMWIATYDRWLASPFLGWGSGSTFWEVFVGWSHTQPHNAVLQFLISWGVVGASGALWLLGRAIVASHRQTARHPTLQPMLAVLYTLLVMSLLEGMLHYPRFIMLIMALFAIILTYRGQEPVVELRP